jgi:hypothetical protein
MNQPMLDTLQAILDQLNARIEAVKTDEWYTKFANSIDPEEYKADVPSRESLERLLGRKLGELNRVQLAKIIENLGDPPRIENILTSFWDDAGKELLGVLTPFLQKLYLTQAAEFLGSQSIGVDWALINQAASNWATSYSFNLVSGITQSTMTALQTAISNYYQTSQTMGTLTETLTGLYGPVRAEMIAVTEITRAASQGELDTVAQILKDNPSLEASAIWQTNKDNKVCPICGPRQGKRQGDGWSDPPPAHPRCRCWINHKIGVRNG